MLEDKKDRQSEETRQQIEKAELDVVDHIH